MRRRHYLGCINHPVSHFAIIKVVLVAIHLMAMNISVLTSRLRLSRYRYTMQRGHPDLHFIKKKKALKYNQDFEVFSVLQCIRGVVPSEDMADGGFALIPYFLNCNTIVFALLWLDPVFPTSGQFFFPFVTSGQTVAVFCSLWHK